VVREAALEGAEAQEVPNRGAELHHVLPMAEAGMADARRPRYDEAES
jgi:hypothetical protein